MVDVEDLIISVRTDESENDSRIGTTFHHFKTLTIRMFSHSSSVSKHELSKCFDPQ
jgi:hypothetical protein